MEVPLALGTYLRLQGSCDSIDVRHSRIDHFQWITAIHVGRYTRNGVHLEYKPDARRAHDGTVEYASRDAHIGAHARRSDLEILAYNLVHWMSGSLPWMDNLKDPK